MTKKMERPERYRNAVAPHIYVNGVADAIEFYSRAFGAYELDRLIHPDGYIVHAEIVIDGHLLMLSDPDSPIFADPRKGGTSVSLHLFVVDAKAVQDRAIAEGCKEIQPVTRKDYGATNGVIQDPFGHVWSILSDFTEEFMN